jgi:dynein heavy chain
LTSGEIMAMSSSMSIQFEVADLAVASPATVSRCGMIYMEPDCIGWRPMMECWLNTIPLNQSQKDMVVKLFDWIVPPSLDFITSSCRETATTSSINMVISLMNLIVCQIDVFGSAYSKELEDVTPPLKDIWITSSFLFGCIWSLGGSLDSKSRSIFDSFFRNLISGNANGSFIPEGVKIEKPIPNGGSIYDYVFERDKKNGGMWKLWVETVGKFEIDPKAKFSSITIPTVDTIRYSHLFELFIKHNKHVLVVGPTGTGKSAYINNILLNGLSKQIYVPVFVNFSAQTSSNQTQDIILSKLDKRRRGVFGPTQGMKSIIFVDDLNMPAREKYGAQPPIELLRQWMDHGQWYDLKDTAPMQLVDIQFITAMGPPGMINAL